MTSVLLVNPRSGSGSPTPAELAQAARELGVDVHLLEVTDDAAEIAANAEADAIGMAGGDGSLAAVAAVAIERDLPFVCVPFGTRNHFARDAGIDHNDPLGALGAFRGVERRVDVGAVGERVFLNNVSLGPYADLVFRRERHRRRSESLARVRAIVRTLSSPGAMPLAVDGEPLRARIVLVANNAYRLAMLSLGERPSLEEGRLHLYTAEGALPRHWDDRSLASLRLDGPRRLRAAVDGEPAVLAPPVEFACRPGALRLLVPPSSEV